MRKARWILLQIAVICSFIGIITKILDWYNPYMNFSGHTFFTQIILYVCVITLAYGRAGKKVKKNRNNE